MNKGEIILPRFLRTVCCSLILATFSGIQTSAAEFEEVAESEEEFIGEIDVVATGTRLQTRSVHDSPAPIDVIQGEDIRGQGTSDLADLVRNVVPSFNVNSQPISDASTLVRPARLRGLPSDNTLVLLNNKRRHRSSVIHWNAGNMGFKGSQGPDISVIPAIALKRLEVLRDGASAQYGSDAIAGVMNFILRDDAEGSSLEVKYGQYSEGSDESAYMIAGNIGLPFTDRGFFNASFDYGESDDTVRSTQRKDAQTLIDEGNTHVKDPVQIWGSPEIDDDLKTVFNLGLELDDSKEFYMFGNYASKEVDGGFYFRNPGTLGGGRVGVFVDGEHPGDNHLIGDLDLTDDINCSQAVTIDPRGHIVNNPHPDKCFSFNQWFPGGFVPRFGGDIEDTSVVAGLRGELDNGFNYDLSASWGRHDSDFFIYNTVNASYGPDSPTSFDPGDYTQTEYSFNADFSYPMEVESFASDLNVAGGLEYRVEDFEITAGDVLSWRAGPLSDQGYSVGSNGFPGFSADIAGDWDRENRAAYLDLEADVTDRWLVGAAVRFEDFDDFGTTTNGKLSTRFDITEWLSLRATWGTGFRAPTPGQSNASNISTGCETLQPEDEVCTLVDIGVLPPSIVARVVEGAANELDSEESTNWTTGLAFRGENWSMTVDYFNIDVDDRISLSKSFVLDDDDRANLASAGVSGADKIYQVQLFVNDMDTETEGFDAVLSYSKKWSASITDLSLAYNYTDTKVKSFSSALIDETIIRDIEDALPESRFNATAVHRLGNWNFLLRYNWTDEWYEREANQTTFGSYWTMDAEASYSFNNGVRLMVGGTNFTDETPDRNKRGATQIGNTYGQFSPLGFNGAFYYGRLVYDLF